MPKKKKTATSGELVMVKSVHRTRSRRMKFCVHGGLGRRNRQLEMEVDVSEQAAPETKWLSRGFARYLLHPPSKDGICCVFL